MLERQEIEALLRAQTGAHHALRPLLMPAVWLMALLSGGVAVASCVVNDYFDMRSDTINAPHKVPLVPLGCLPVTSRLELTHQLFAQPLPSGVVPPDGALLLASSVYMFVLIAACLLVRAGAGCFGVAAAGSHVIAGVVTHLIKYTKCQ